MLHTRGKEEQYEMGQLGTYNLFLPAPMSYIVTDILDVNSSVQLSGLFSEPNSFSFPKGEPMMKYGPAVSNIVDTSKSRK